MSVIIGRDKEKKELLDLYNSSKSEFVAVYGRRRVGKTYLIRETFRDCFSFYHTGLSIYGDKPVTTKDQLKHFYHTLTQYFPDSSFSMPKTWMNAMYILEDCLAKSNNGDRQVVFIDELPWLDTDGSDFMVAIEAFWNGWAAGRDNIMFIVCGSASSWMIKNLINNKGGLYGRLTWEIKLAPFTLNECELFLKSKNITLSRYDIVQTYMFFGGIPYYLNYFQQGLSFAQNVDNILFAKNAKLALEFDKLFSSLFKNHDIYMKIVRFLYSKRCGYSRSEIAKHLRIESGGTLTKLLTALQESDFIRSYKPYDSKKYETLYCLSDSFCRAYIHFKEKNQIMDSNFWQRNINTPMVNSWCGIAFEEICFAHIDKIKNALQIGGISSTDAPYTLRGDETHNGTQCDLIIDRKDRVVNLCEIKFCTDVFEIDKAYDAVIRHRMSVLQGTIPKTKNLQFTMVTTFGVKSNMYSGIVQSQVTLDDLFK
ncbi:MAG: AAA family ATPase [Paludibacteraceae bacterium]|nr:AAA family ATPase [Paludibacteraceae bacterium]